MRRRRKLRWPAGLRTRAAKRRAHEAAIDEAVRNGLSIEVAAWLDRRPERRPRR